VSNFDKHVSVWAWLGRVLPLTALFALVMALVFDFQVKMDYILYGIALGFGVTAFIWWWWVIYAVKSLTNMLEDNRQRFIDVVKELKTIRRDLNREQKKK
jgi:hypothetical protein